MVEESFYQKISLQLKSELTQLWEKSLGKLYAENKKENKKEIKMKK